MIKLKQQKVIKGNMFLSTLLELSIMESYYFRLKIKAKRSDKIGTTKKHIISAIPAPAFSI